MKKIILSALCLTFGVFVIACSSGGGGGGGGAGYFGTLPDGQVITVACDLNTNLALPDENGTTYYVVYPIIVDSSANNVTDYNTSKAVWSVSSKAAGTFVSLSSETLSGVLPVLKGAKKFVAGTNVPSKFSITLTLNGTSCKADFTPADFDISNGGGGDSATKVFSNYTIAKVPDPTADDERIATHDVSGGVNAASCEYMAKNDTRTFFFCKAYQVKNGWNWDWRIYPYTGNITWSTDAPGIISLTKVGTNFTPNDAYDYRYVKVIYNAAGENGEKAENKCIWIAVTPY